MATNTSSIEGTIGSMRFSSIAFAASTAGMRALAACANVAVKLSGLGTFVRECSAALWRPVIEETLDLFTPARCMFGSNFPIESLWTTYGYIVAVMHECLAGLMAAERRAVLHDTAARLYRL